MSFALLIVQKMAFEQIWLAMDRLGKMHLPEIQSFSQQLRTVTDLATVAHWGAGLQCRSLPLHHTSAIWIVI